MESVLLATTGKRTTRVGFGCSGIAGGLERRRSLALLEAAYDAGIRHFDVAPMYGYGTAEEVLGSFAQRHAEVTVATKFGILPVRQSRAAQAVRSIAKRVLPTRVLHRPDKAPAEPHAVPDLQKAEFTEKLAEESLQRSLRLLRRETVDLFLLHECAAGELRDPRLLEALHSWTAQGRIGAFGVGSPASALPALLEQRGAYCPVVQSEWSAFHRRIQADARFRLTHRSLHGPWRAWHRQLLSQPVTLLHLCEQTNCDLADASLWPRLLLRAATLVNSGTILLFSTRDPGRIQSNCEAAHDQALDRGATGLHAYLSTSTHAGHDACCTASI